MASVEETMLTVIVMGAEGPKRLFGTVGGRREAVGAEPYPREKREQGNLVKAPWILDIARRADDPPSQSLAKTPTILPFVVAGIT
jgi:hypothetical protein